ncbi:MAG TPA: signal peptide peptidase SppA, partial [Candidatus Paceibacterota bacterium]|nr:signal peptide peptidase SppA [Candidatus Paceibacterota bacterium]
VTASDEVIEYLRTARENETIKGVLLDIESAGGYPVPSEEIAQAVAGVGKPSVAWLRQVAASGAYWVASAADTVVASANSDVGSIGVSMSYLDYAAQNETDGLTFNSLASGKFKDSGSPDKELTEEERALFERDITIMHDNFVSAIATNRNLPKETVSALADGSTMLGAMAKEQGLVDQLGGQTEAYAALEAAIGEKPVICWAGL